MTEQQQRGIEKLDDELDTLLDNPTNLTEREQFLLCTLSRIVEDILYSDAKEYVANHLTTLKDALT